MTALVLAPPPYTLPRGLCGASDTHGGPYCADENTRPYPAGDRCRRHPPVNRKTGKPDPYLSLAKGAA